jgi:glycerate kinase
VKIEVACDVDNPLTGKRGASAIFGPQKGATDEMISLLDQNLAHYANIISTELNINVSSIPGAGAAGGLGAGLLAFLNAELKRGVDIVIKAVELEKHMIDASFVITGEGKIDSQTIYGKTPIGVAKIAKKYHVPVIGLAGLIGEDSEIVYEHGIDVLFSIVPGVVTLEDALANAKEYTTRKSENIARMIVL